MRTAGGASAVNHCAATARSSSPSRPGRGEHREVQRAARDVDVGDLLGHGLEGGQRAAELLPGAYVAGGHRQCPGERAVAERAGAQDREPVQVVEAVRPAQRLGRDRVEPDRAPQQRHAGCGRVDHGHGHPAGRRGDRDQDAMRLLGVRRLGLGAGDDPSGGGGGAWPLRHRIARLGHARRSAPGPRRPASRSRRCSAEPQRAIGSTPRASVASAGTAIARRPISVSTIAVSAAPSPGPPRSAGTARVSRPAWPSAFHTRSGVSALPSSTSPARRAIVSCASSGRKSGPAAVVTSRLEHVSF